MTQSSQINKEATRSGRGEWFKPFEKQLIQTLIDQDPARLSVVLKEKPALMGELASVPYWKHILCMPGGKEALSQHYPKEGWEELITQVFMNMQGYGILKDKSKWGSAIGAYNNSEAKKRLEELLWLFQNRFGDWPEIILKRSTSHASELDEPHVFSWVRCIWLKESSLSQKTSLTKVLLEKWRRPDVQLLLALTHQQEEYEAMRRWSQTYLTEESKATSMDGSVGGKEFSLTSNLTIVSWVEELLSANLERETWRMDVINELFKNDYSMFMRDRVQFNAFKQQVKQGKFLSLGLSESLFEATVLDRLKAWTWVKKDQWNDPENPHPPLPSLEAGWDRKIPAEQYQSIRVWGQAWLASPKESQEGGQASLEPGVIQWVLALQWMAMQRGKNLEGALYWMCRSDGWVPISEEDYGPLVRHRTELDRQWPSFRSEVSVDRLARVMHWIGRAGFWKELDNNSSASPNWVNWMRGLMELNPMVPEILAHYRAKALETEWSAVPDENPSTKPKKRL